MILGKRVEDFDGSLVHISDGTTIQANKVIWAAGIRGNSILGLPKETITYGNRIKVNRFNEVEGIKDVFASAGAIAVNSKPSGNC